MIDVDESGYAIVERRKEDNRRIVRIFFIIFIVGPLVFSFTLSLLMLVFIPVTKLVDIYYVSYSHLDFNSAEVGAIQWNCDLDYTEFTVPDTIGLHKINTLGGYGGHEVSSFTVEPDDAHYLLGYSIYDDEYLQNNIQIPNDNYSECKIVINLGEYIDSINRISLKHWLVNRVEMSNNWHEPQTYDIICKIEYYFNVDPENKTFYSENGVVYWRDTNEPVEELK